MQMRHDCIMSLPLLRICLVESLSLFAELIKLLGCKVENVVMVREKV